MQTGYTGHIASSEWRWVTLLGSILVLLAVLPFLWVVLNTAGQPQQQFMGALHDYPAAASELGKVVQGAQGALLGRYLHTPEPHNGVLIDIAYVLLGRVARFTALPTIVIYHVARVGASIFMYAAIYSLAAQIWMRVRTRQLFFLLAVIGSGLGWLFAPLTGSPAYPDLTPAVAYPFATTLLNMHLPLATGIAALLVSAMIEVLRPGYNVNPNVQNAGIRLFSYSLLFTLLYPQGLLPLMVAFVGLLLARSIRKRHLTQRTVRWMLWFGVPALPLLVYYASIFLYNPVVARVWIQVNQAPAPRFDQMLIGLGLPLLIALPGIWRAVRKFEPDGNQFMLLWLIALLLLTYLTPVIQMNFMLGIMLPIAYFGARALEDFWLAYLSRNWRYRVVVALIPLLGISHLYVLFLPVASLTDRDPRTNPGFTLELDYALALRWLAATRPPRQWDWTILAAPQVSVWVPAWTGMHVVYGYPAGALNAPAKRAAVERWYGEADAASPLCTAMLNGIYTAAGRYTIRYVLYGPRERALGAGACLDVLTPVAGFGSVQVYAYADSTQR
ncbi:MAG: hypothetical protein H7Y11_07785 [Armatimonadetes bacterium]|nr:hypothetical protein [Anaerolineae bacterium]